MKTIYAILCHFGMIYSEAEHFDCPESTEFSDNCFSIIGKAIFYATFFESNFVSFTKIEELKINCLTSDKPDFEIIFEKINKRTLNVHIDHFIKLHKIEYIKEILENLKEILHDARKSRNFIAHDICKGIEYIIETDEGQNKIIQQIKEEIYKIAKADVIICYLIQIFNKEIIPDSSIIETYPNNVLNWVLGK